MMPNRHPSPSPHCIGTSGWSYPQWKEGFYGKTPPSVWLSLYAAHFSSVEINNSFYRLPTEKALQKWYDAAPSGFRFAVKAWRKITHDNALKDVEEDTQFYLKRMLILKEKLACVLFQLPPGLARDDGLLKNFFGTLPKGLRYAVEFRHASWNAGEVAAMLADHGIARCHSLWNNALPQGENPTDWAYLRFHGPQRYKGEYAMEYLQACADWTRGQQIESVFGYFNNTIGAQHALENARSFELLLQGWKATTFRRFFPQPSSRQS